MKTNYLLSTSSFFSLSQYNQKQETIITNSHFSHSFSNIIYSCSINYKLNLFRNIFSNFLNSSIFIAETENTDIAYQKFKISQNYTQYSRYGNITIINCIFEQCISDFGGGIYVLQKCVVMIHGTFFNQCRAKDGGGSFICATHKYRNENHDYSEFVLSINVQYCCFNQCFAQYYPSPRVMGFGSCLLGSSEKTLFSYVTTYNSTYNENTYGAQFDMYSLNISTKHFNVTKNIATFTGSVEYRQVGAGNFQFNTITYLESKYTTYFSLFGKIEFSNCNFIGNYVRGNPNGVNLPALICQDFKQAAYLTFMFNIVDCFFYKNEYAERCSITQSFTNKGKITLINCFSDKYTITDVDYINTINCNLNYGDNLKISIIPHINLGDCDGDYEVPDFYSPSLTFSCSNAFSFSQRFTLSNYFSKSNQFSLSKEFSFSEKFSETKDFSNSDQFSFSEKFTETKVFSNSDQFSFSEEFSKTKDFSNSDQFSFSEEFSKTEMFSNSNQFSLSNEYTLSSFFSNSRKFSESEIESEMTTLFGKYTFTLTITITFVSRRSVSLSLSFSLSNSLSYLLINNNYYTMINSQYFYEWPFPYIIKYMSQSYTETYIPILLYKRKRISGEQLIGIVCGSVAIFFFILGIIILSLRKKEEEFDDYDYSEDESANENKDHNKDEISFINNSSDDDLKFWL